MSALADLPELVGFFSYSREDDQDSFGALSALRARIQAELRQQLGRTPKTFRLWQDKEAIPSGTLWESEIRNAVAQSVFFIPIITPTVVASRYCKFELESFLAREAELGRNDLVFPILYVDVPELQDVGQREKDAVLSLIAKRQYRDWLEFRYLDINASELRREVARFCTDIRNALRRSWVSPEERKEQEVAAALQQAEAERQRQEVEARRRAEEEARQRAAEEERQKREAEAARQAEEDARQRAAQEERQKREVKAQQQAEEAARQRAAEEERQKREAGAEHQVEAERGKQEQLAKQPLPAPRPKSPWRRLVLMASVIGAAVICATGVWIAAAPPSLPAVTSPVAPVQIATPAPISAPPAPISTAAPISAAAAPISPPAAASVAPRPSGLSVLSSDQERALKPKDTFKECINCPQMMVLPPGDVDIGSAAGELPHNPNEEKQHKVTLTRQFAVGQFELTFDEWDACFADGGCNGYRAEAKWGRGRLPVINISWNDAKAYVAWLSQKTGKPYRLLTEAEYEYATRARTNTAYPWGRTIGNNNANCKGCGSQWDGKETAPVGSFAPNRFGLYDMVGNVWAWTEDCYHDSYSAAAPADGSAWIAGDCSTRVIRGGSWDDEPGYLRSARRLGNHIGNQSIFFGFRVARDLLTP